MSTPYSDEELIADIDWLYGGHDQGQRDDVRQAHVIRTLHEDQERAIQVLTAYAKTCLEPPRTIENVAAFIEFVGWYLEFDI